MPEIAEHRSDGASSRRDDARYDETYYRTGLGPTPYGRTPEWLGHFAGVADGIVRTFAPRTVLDVGCAFGMLVEMLWDRGVRAEGVDVSEYAISQARPDIRPYVRVQTAVDSLGGPYDLITCVEVLEHLDDREIALSIAAMTAATDTILFSSTPDDFDEPTHVSVRPPLAWIRDFSAAGFGVDLSADPTLLAPHAILFRRMPERQTEEIQVLYARLIRERVLSHTRFGAIMAARHDASQAKASLAEVEQRSEMRAHELELRITTLTQEYESRIAALVHANEIARVEHEQNHAKRNAHLAERARIAETAADELEAGLTSALALLESDDRATRDAVHDANVAVNRIVTSPIWRLKKALRGSRS